MTEQNGSPANPGLPLPSESASEAREQSPRRGSTAQDLLHSHDQRDAISLPEFSAFQSLRGRLVQRRLSNIPNGSDDELTRHFVINTYTLVRQEPRWYDWAVNMWQSEVSIKVDARHRRDHLGTCFTSDPLERTFMGYLRTSLALSMTGVTIAQLFRIQHSYNPEQDFGFFVTGTPLAACFIIAAIIVLSLGAIRFWRQQSAIVRGKVIAGGWEINFLMIMAILLCVTLFAIVVGVSIDKAIDKG
ncbi:hypothetical protein EG328_011576 [Venturia inaequalis]|uniref:DUF202 domain-containing protein n=1 Tax=Venturia inaequalis TaxID=5025 RepID=A0A8H3Z6Y9_VENIN|nr:hypothetical protein EG328_011576 [Venturia inaequalis]KAE9987744.1 hypothetical protein EG327_003647 [Venturia inaequalis]RDI89855.1 hypothetical protein Vi05172_g199 [Venturia inaequalis]